MLGYRPGDVDGHYGSATASAVMAYQKHEGLQRDGVTGPAGARPPSTARRPERGPQGGAGLEIDLDRQIMFVVSLDGTYQILNVSTGNNESYRHPAGYTAVAVTPKGTYAVGRKIDAEEHAPLGTLYRPMYFHGGYAVHGSRSVPAYPASHGCVRVSYEDEDWLFPIIRAGDARHRCTAAVTSRLRSASTPAPDSSTAPDHVFPRTPRLQLTLAGGADALAMQCASSSVSSRGSKASPVAQRQQQVGQRRVAGQHRAVQVGPDDPAVDRALGAPTVAFTDLDGARAAGRRRPAGCARRGSRSP